MRLKKWCKHIVVWCNTIYVTDENPIVDVSHWNYCPICGKQNPMKKK